MSLKNYAKSGHAAWMCNRMYIPRSRLHKSRKGKYH